MSTPCLVAMPYVWRVRASVSPINRHDDGGRYGLFITTSDNYADVGNLVRLEYGDSVKIRKIELIGRAAHSMRLALEDNPESANALSADLLLEDET